ncbi:hypothetical protein GGS21DRAFT_535191 [Xylaria nigripes]|nr:hypothetical protein GGS21DRAFT_535191 [Xylaria nigripes]
MHHANLFLGVLWVVGAYARYISSGDASQEESDSPVILSNVLRPPKDPSPLSPPRKDRRDNYPINCHIHNWPSASVKSIKDAYDWFYQLWAPFEADAQHCRRIACYGDSGVWLCADSLQYQNPNSVSIADAMNYLLNSNYGCLDKGNSSKVQGQYFTSDGWNVIVRGGEDCRVDAAEQPIFY